MQKPLIIGSQTLGSPTEIYMVLNGGLMGKYEVHIIDNETSLKTFRIERIISELDLVRMPETRAERRKRNRKNHR